MTSGQGVAKTRIERKDSLPAIEKPKLSAEVAFILIAVAILAAAFYVVPDAWWGL